MQMVIENCLDYLENEKKVEKELCAIEALNVKSCCESTYIIQASGSCVCFNCGLVLENQVYDDTPFSFQTGANNMFLHSTVSEMYPKSSFGTTIGGNTRLARMQNWNSMPYSERVIWEVSTFVKAKLSNKFSDVVINNTLTLYKKIYINSPVCRGKNKKGMVAACVYYSAKQNRISLSTKHVAHLMGLDLAVVNKSISKYLELSMESMSISSTSAADYLQLYFNKYNTQFKVQKLMKRVCDFVEVKGMLRGSTPQVITTSVFYFILIEMKNENTPTLRDLSVFSNIGLPSIKKVVTILQAKKNYIFSSLV